MIEEIYFVQYAKIKIEEDMFCNVILKIVGRIFILDVQLNKT